MMEETEGTTYDMQEVQNTATCSHNYKKISQDAHWDYFQCSLCGAGYCSASQPVTP